MGALEEATSELLKRSTITMSCKGEVRDNEGIASIVFGFAIGFRCLHVQKTGANYEDPERGSRAKA